jgi:hypothetical protein
VAPVAAAAHDEEEDGDDDEYNEEDSNLELTEVVLDPLVVVRCRSHTRALWV